MDGKIREQLTNYVAAAEALLVSMNTSAPADGKSVWRYGSFRTYARKYNQLVKAVTELVANETVADLYNLDNMPSEYYVAADQQKEIFEDVHANLSVLIEFLDSKLGVRTDRFEA